MTDEEFDIIDQLYFVIGYTELTHEISMLSSEMSEILWNLIEKGWVKCLSNPETEVWPNKDQFATNYSNYYYLATKKGLFKHNEI